MDRTEITVRNLLKAIKAPLYDIGLLSNRGMLPGLDRIPADDLLYLADIPLRKRADVCSLPFAKRKFS